VEDHVHILFALSRTECLADIVGKVKGSSSVWIKEQWPRQKDFAWQAGYGALSVGQGEVEVVVHYIQNQEEHHRKLTFQEEYRMWMRLAGIELDERYVWD
jgi:REP element-mobilizing transposase RayT